MKRVREERVYTIEELPPKTRLEIAIIGRSNVGKSSLVNALLGYKTAQVAQRPGATLWLGMHELGEKTLIDLPGYGYAATGLDRRLQVSDLVGSYFRLRRTDLVLMLIDMRRGVMDIDKMIMREIPAHIELIGTKADKKDAIHSENYLLCCSTVNNSNIAALRDYILQL